MGGYGMMRHKRSFAEGLEVGHTTLARIDRELAPICEGKPVDRFCKCVNDRWKKYVPKSEAE